MAGLTGLFKRGGSFYLRIVLPKQHPLLSKYANGHFVQTLGACSHREAVRRGTIRRAEVLGVLDLQRERVPRGQLVEVFKAVLWVTLKGPCGAAR